ncbi:red chlorophyll catabolite reductase isoform X1 [Cannabis sativa]|uniref:red chlorophyll catabolite reductase isoform X1 n=1 Tax=Cannabis sativa TaxID=3483 RepID=UPI0029C9B6AE|nr:red chlorophyll catabolite reductase isoform X1 [Cannabis sativa]
MAVVFSHGLSSPLSSSSFLTASLQSSSLTRPPSNSVSVSAFTTPFRMELDNNERRRKFIEFPYVSSSHKKLMVDLVSMVETRLDSQLLPCTLPPDVQYYQNQNDTSHASLHIRSGHPSSPIDFILGSWIHCQLPTGGALNITSLSTYLKSSTDSPNFFMDIIRSSPTSLVLILDIPPRRDLALYPDYLKKYYEDTNLEAQRQVLEKVPEFKPYFSPSLYIRAFVSPTVITARIESDSVERMEEIIQDHVGVVAKQVLETWLDTCAVVENGDEVDENEREYLQKRDLLVRSKTIEIDLASSLPRLFGPETADRIITTIQKYSSASSS